MSVHCLLPALTKWDSGIFKSFSWCDGALRTIFKSVISLCDEAVHWEFQFILPS